MRDRINLAFIGCGGFARAMHLPIVLKNPKYRVYAVTDVNPEAMRAFAADAGAPKCYDRAEDLLGDPEVDAVLIATRHDTHAALSILAAEAGKHILCEKPMGLSDAECRAVTEAVRKAGVVYTVGYNRGMAPMVLRARDLLRTLPGKKLMIYHRIQAPFPEDSWTHIPEVGGGRFVGEGCHIFDLLCELAPGRPASVFASGGTFLDPERVKIADSAIVTLTFEDGSVGTTLIASAGCPDFPKEATEIYCANRAIFISDFNHLESYGFEGKRKVTMDFSETDKGHSLELDQFADAVLTGAPAPNGLVKARRAAVISYKVVESVRTGRPIPIDPAEYEG
jgi:predicted dehydrogenase